MDADSEKADNTVLLVGNMEPSVKLTQTDFKQRLKTIDFAAAGAWMKTRRNNIRGWGTFVNTNKFAVPANPGVVAQRLVRNVDYFQSNYIFVFFGLVIYCLLTSPLLLIAVAAAGGAAYIVKLKNAEHQIKVLGHELSLAQQYCLVALCSFPLFYLAGGGTAVFWIIGASFFLIVLHATFYAIEAHNTGMEAFDLEMETV